MIKAIDNSEVISPYLVKNPIFGGISPNKLSGTVKTLILVKNDPEHIFNGAWMGEDAAPWLLRIGEKCDRTIRLGYIMPFQEPFTMRIINSDHIITSYRDYIDEAVYWGSIDLGV